MPSLWEDIKNKLLKSLSFAADKTEEYTLIGKAKVDILNIKKNIDKTHRKLGEEVYPIIIKDQESALAKNKKIKSLLIKIDELKKSLSVKEKEIEIIKKDAAAKEKKRKTTSQAEKKEPEKKETPKAKETIKKPAQKSQSTNKKQSGSTTEKKI
jgi:hypothetical protein